MSPGHRGHSLVITANGVVYGTGYDGNGELTGRGDRAALTPLVWDVSNIIRPRITGIPRLGQRLTAHHGQWWPAPDSFRYRWYRNGTAIRGEARRVYRLVARDVGTRLQVRVTAAHNGFRSTIKQSLPTATIRPQR